MSIKSKIQALIAAANTATGESDATLTDAVQTLVDGYGQGGGGDSSLLDSLIDGTITSINYSGSTIRSYAFYGCSELKNLVFPKATTIRNYAFTYTGIEEVTTTNFPLITSFANSAFQGCTKLTRVFLPDVTIGGTAFSGCTSLKTAVFKTFASNTNFNVCSALEAVDNIGGGTVGASTFNACRALTTLVLRSGTLCKLSNTSALSGTPFASGGAGGTIYIPKALYDHLGDGSSLDYKAATNWSTVDGYGTITWAQIEGSIYETQYADGTPIPAS